MVTFFYHDVTLFFFIIHLITSRNTFAAKDIKVFREFLMFYPMASTTVLRLPDYIEKSPQCQTPCSGACKAGPYSPPLTRFSSASTCTINVASVSLIVSGR